MKSAALSRLSLGVVSALSVVSIDAAQADLRLFVAGGLNTLTPEADAGETAPKYSGGEGKVAGHFDVFSPVPGLSLYAGPEFRLVALTSEETNQGVVSKLNLDSNFGGLEAGVNFGMIPMVTLQAGYNYSSLLSGEVKAQSPLTSVSVKASSGSESGITLRGLITPFPLTRLGVEYSLGNGSAKYDGDETASKYSFWAARAVVGIAL